MLDRELVVHHTAAVREVLKTRGENAVRLLDGFLELNMQRKALITSTETLRARKNAISDEIPKLKKAKEPPEVFRPLIAEASLIKLQLEQDEKELKRLEAAVDEVLETLPNLPQGHLERVLVDAMPEEERRYFRALHQLEHRLDAEPFHLPQDVLNRVLGLLLTEAEVTEVRTVWQLWEESQEHCAAALERIKVLDAEFAQLSEE
jgi:seryl-tRNA synthetase